MPTRLYEVPPGGFRHLRPMIHDKLKANMNIVSRDEHVPEIERYIRTVKERVRGTYGVLPFASLPTRMIIELVYNSIFWLNAFPFEDGVSSTLSPRVLVIGKPIDYTKHCRIEFGSYAQVHEEHDNSMVSRTTGAISLGPTGNSQGSYFFLSLVSGRSINRGRWSELPITEDVIRRVNAIGTSCREGRDLTFAYKDGTPMVDIDGPVEEPNDDNTTVDGSVVEEDIIVVENGEVDNPPPVINILEEDNDEDIGHRAGVDHYPPAEIEMVHPYDLRPRNEHGRVDDELAHDMARHVEREYDGVAGHGYNLRPRAPPTNEHLHCNITETALTQYSIKRALKLFGDRAAEAVLAEMKQLHDRGVISPQDGTTLSKEQKMKSLEYLMFLKEKNNGTIKGRGCADGRKQPQRMKLLPLLWLSNQLCFLA